MKKLAALVVVGLLPLAGCAAPYNGYDYESAGPAYGPGYDQGYQGPPAPYYGDAGYGPAYAPGYGCNTGCGSVYGQSSYSYGPPPGYAPPPSYMPPPPAYDQRYRSTYYSTCGCVR